MPNPYHVPAGSPKGGQFTSGQLHTIETSARKAAGISMKDTKIGKYLLKDLGSGIFKLYDGDTIAASLIVQRHSNSSIPALDGIDVFEKYRGQGLGRKILSVLLEHYGSIRSSNAGNTSDDAMKMWKSLGARTLLTTDRGYGKSFYVLEK